MNENSVLFCPDNLSCGATEIEELKECALGTRRHRGHAEAPSARGNPKGYMHAVVGVYPPRRVGAQHTLEIKKMKEANYMADVFSQQLRIEQDKYTVAMINSVDGTDYDLARAMQKEVIFCGAPNDDIVACPGNPAQLGDLPRAPRAGKRRDPGRPGRLPEL